MSQIDLKKVDEGKIIIYVSPLYIIGNTIKFKCFCDFWLNIVYGTCFIHNFN